MTLTATKPRVFLTGGDRVNWALDTDLRMTSEALADTVELTDLTHSDIVHSMWWEGLAEIPLEHLVGKRVICQVACEPFRDLTATNYHQWADHVGLWIAQTAEAQQQLTSIGQRCELVPYTVDTTTFKNIAADSERAQLRERCGLPANQYIIANFHRDTEGRDLISPKLVKGPDVFLEILRTLAAQNVDFHVLLAGPRRHWLRKQCDTLGIPHTYLGQDTGACGDDIATNTLPQKTINTLYNLSDLYVVSSRSEGGPRSLLEAAAARCKVISTPVGLATELLESDCIYSCPAAAAEIITADMRCDHLADTLDTHEQTIHARHLPKHATAQFERIYAKVTRTRPVVLTQQNRFVDLPSNKSSSVLRAGIWHQFFAPPYGGGNQFVLALCKELARRSDVEVIQNDITSDIDAYLLNSIHFDIDRFVARRRQGDLKVVHRIDGPIHLIRGHDREMDDFCFDLNADLADSTVLQSAWTYERIVEMGYRPIRPVIIHNAVDPDIFHRRGKVDFDPGRKIRLISTSWSNNTRKGGPTYRWIDENLDWSRFEYTFVGRTSEPLRNIRVIPPVPSEPLAEILRAHDIYITASRNDPCSNALIEALACGLPALYYNDGGHPELVGQGGLPFREVDQIFPQIDAIIENYASFQNLIAIPALRDVAAKYLALLTDAAS